MRLAASNNLFYYMKKIIKIITKKLNANLILIDSPFYGDNAKVLLDYILEHKPQYKVVYFIEKNQKVTSHAKVKYIERAYQVGAKAAHKYSLISYYYAAKAKYVFYTHSFEWPGDRVKGQLVINLWHGTGYKGSRGVRKENVFDYMMVPGDVFVKSKAMYFGCEEDRILTFGYPRYDLYQKNRFEKVNQFFSSLNIDIQKEKVILWLPTFFVDDDLLAYENPLPYVYSGLPLIERLEQMTELNEFCRANHIKLVIKKHNFKHALTPLDTKMDQFENVLNLSDLEFRKFSLELYELLPFTSALISDFSSAAVDYLLLDKPLAYTLSDLEDYRKTRGFVFDDPAEYMPGYHVYHLDNLKAFIFDVAQGEDKHQQTRENKMSVMHNKTDNYTRRILEHFNL